MRHVRVFWSAFSGATGACTRCGAKDVSPDPGPLGTVGDLFGLARYLCSDCRHRFWLRAGSRPHHDGPVPSVEEAGSPVPEPGVPPVPPASLAVLDVEAASAPPGPPDLSVLDADLARLRGQASKERRRRKRAELDETLPTRP